jgi:hypothetical protein
MIKLENENELDEIKSLRSEAESYQKELNEKVILNLNSKIENIFRKYL